MKISNKLFNKMLDRKYSLCELVMPDANGYVLLSGIDTESNPGVWQDSTKGLRLTVYKGDSSSPVGELTLFNEGLNTTVIVDNYNDLYKWVKNAYDDYMKSQPRVTEEDILKAIS